jgi:hypothetical protein
MRDEIVVKTQIAKRVREERLCKKSSKEKEERRGDARHCMLSHAYKCLTSEKLSYAAAPKL